VKVSLLGQIPLDDAPAQAYPSPRRFPPFGYRSAPGEVNL
jgi:hypothetical protein